MRKRPISTWSRINLLATCAVVLTTLALVAGRQVIAQASRPDDVQAVSLCFDLPAIGNVESVAVWEGVAASLLPIPIWRPSHATS